MDVPFRNLYMFEARKFMVAICLTVKSNANDLIAVAMRWRHFLVYDFYSTFRQMEVMLKKTLVS